MEGGASIPQLTFQFGFSIVDSTNSATRSNSPHFGENFAKVGTLQPLETIATVHFCTRGVIRRHTRHSAAIKLRNSLSSASMVFFASPNSI
jgi:hypothetical protein